MLTYGACACARACPHLVANETTEEQIGCARSAHTHHRGHEADACRHLAAFRRRVRRPHLLKELREDRALRCEDVPVAVHHGSAGALVSGHVLVMPRCEVCVRSVQTQLRCHGLHERRPLPGVRARRWRLRTHRRRATFAADLIGTSPPRTLRDGDQKGGKQGEWRWDRERRERERERQSRLVVESQSGEREPTAAHSAGRDDGVACSLPGNVAEYERSTEAQRQRPSARRVIFAPGPHATGLSGAASAPAPTALILVHR